MTKYTCDLSKNLGAYFYSSYLHSVKIWAKCADAKKFYTHFKTLLKNFFSCCKTFSYFLKNISKQFPNFIRGYLKWSKNAKPPRTILKILVPSTKTQNIQIKIIKKLSSKCQTFLYNCLKICTDIIGRIGNFRSYAEN